MVIGPWYKLTKVQRREVEVEEELENVLYNPWGPGQTNFDYMIDDPVSSR